MLEPERTAAWGRGEQDFLSSAGNAPRWGSCPSSVAPWPHSSLWVSWGGAPRTLGCWRAAEPLGLARSSLLSWGCHEGGCPWGNVAALRGPLCCCPCRWRVTPARWGTGLAQGMRCSSPCPGGARTPSARQPLAVPQLSPAGLFHWHLCEPGPLPPWPGDTGRQGGRSACPGQGSRVLLPSPQAQSSPREVQGTNVLTGVLVGLWCWLLGSGPYSGSSSIAPWTPPGMGHW